MNLLHLIASIIVSTAFYAAAENDPRAYDNVRSKRDGVVVAGVQQPRFYYPNDNYYSSQPNYYYPSQYYKPSRSSYYPATYQQAQPSNYYYYPQAPVAPSPVNVIKSLISRQDGPLKPYGYNHPYYGTSNRPRKKKKKLFVPNVWG